MDSNCIQSGDIIALDFDNMGIFSLPSRDEPISEREETISHLRIWKGEVNNADFTRCMFRISTEPGQKKSISFGALINLIHVPTNFIVVGGNKIDLGHKEEKLTCVLLQPFSDARLDASHKWIILPRYKLRSEGDPVRSRDHIILRNAQYKHLHLNAFYSSNSPESDGLVGLAPHNVIIQKPGIQIILLQSYLYTKHEEPQLKKKESTKSTSLNDDSNQDSNSNLVIGGDYLRILHRECYSHVICRIDDNDEITSSVTPLGAVSRKLSNNKDNTHTLFLRRIDSVTRKIAYDFPAPSSSLGIWQILPIDPFNENYIQGPISYGSKVRFRHVISGQYFSIRPVNKNDSKTIKTQTYTISSLMQGNIDYCVATTAACDEYSIFEIEQVDKVSSQINFINYRDNLTFIHSITNSRFQMGNPSSNSLKRTWWEYQFDLPLTPRPYDSETIVASDVCQFERVYNEEIQDTLYCMRFFPLTRAATCVLQLTPTSNELYLPLFRHLNNSLLTLSLWLLGATDNEPTLLSEDVNSFKLSSTYQNITSLIKEDNNMDENYDSSSEKESGSDSKYTSDAEDDDKEDSNDLENNENKDVEEEEEADKSPDFMENLVRQLTEDFTIDLEEDENYDRPSSFAPWLGRSLTYKGSILTKNYLEELTLSIRKNFVDRELQTSAKILRRQTILSDTRIIEQLLHFLNTFLSMLRAINLMGDINTNSLYPRIPPIIQKCSMNVEELLQAFVHQNDYSALKIIAIHGIFQSMISQKIMGWNPPIEAIIKLACLTDKGASKPQHESTNSSKTADHEIQGENILKSTISRNDIRQIIEQMHEMHMLGNSSALNIMTLLTGLCKSGTVRSYFQNTILNCVVKINPSTNPSLNKGEGNIGDEVKSMLFNLYKSKDSDKWIVKFESKFAFPTQDKKNPDDVREQLEIESSSLKDLFNTYNTVESQDDILDVHECFSLLEDLGFGGPFLYKEIAYLMGSNIWGFLRWWCFRASFYYPASSITHCQISPYQAMSLMEMIITPEALKATENKLMQDSKSLGVVDYARDYFDIIESRIPGFKLSRTKDFTVSAKSSPIHLGPRIDDFFIKPNNDNDNNGGVLKISIDSDSAPKSSNNNDLPSPRISKALSVFKSNTIYEFDKALERRCDENEWFRFSLKLIVELCRGGNNYAQSVISKLLPPECLLDILSKEGISIIDKSILFDLISMIYVDHILVFPTRFVPLFNSSYESHNGENSNNFSFDHHVASWSICGSNEVIYNSSLSAGKLFCSENTGVYRDNNTIVKLIHTLFRIISNEIQNISLVSAKETDLMFNHSLLNLLLLLIQKGVFGESSLHFWDVHALQNQKKSSSSNYSFYSKDFHLSMDVLQNLLLSKLKDSIKDHHDLSMGLSEIHESNKTTDNKQTKSSKPQSSKFFNRTKKRNLNNIQNILHYFDEIYSDLMFKKVFNSTVSILKEIFMIQQGLRLQIMWNNLSNTAHSLTKDFFLNYQQFKSTTKSATTSTFIPSSNIQDPTSSSPEKKLHLLITKKYIANQLLEKIYNSKNVVDDDFVEGIFTITLHSDMELQRICYDLLNQQLSINLHAYELLERGIVFEVNHNVSFLTRLIYNYNKVLAVHISKMLEDSYNTKDNSFHLLDYLIKNCVWLFKGKFIDYVSQECVEIDFGSFDKQKPNSKFDNFLSSSPNSSKEELDELYMNHLNDTFEMYFLNEDIPINVAKVVNSSPKITTKSFSPNPAIEEPVSPSNSLPSIFNINEVKQLEDELTLIFDLTSLTQDPENLFKLFQNYAIGRNLNKIESTPLNHLDIIFEKISEIIFPQLLKLIHYPEMKPWEKMYSAEKKLLGTLFEYISKLSRYSLYLIQNKSLSMLLENIVVYYYPQCPISGMVLHLIVTNISRKRMDIAPANQFSNALQSESIGVINLGMQTSPFSVNSSTEKKINFRSPSIFSNIEEPPTRNHDSNYQKSNSLIDQLNRKIKMVELELSLNPSDLTHSALNKFPSSVLLILSAASKSNNSILNEWCINIIFSQYQSMILVFRIFRNNNGLDSLKAMDKFCLFLEIFHNCINFKHSTSQLKVLMGLKKLYKELFPISFVRRLMNSATFPLVSKCYLTTIIQMTYKYEELPIENIFYTEIRKFRILSNLPISSQFEPHLANVLDCIGYFVFPLLLFHLMPLYREQSDENSLNPSLSYDRILEFIFSREVDLYSAIPFAKTALHSYRIPFLDSIELGIMEYVNSRPFYFQNTLNMEDVNNSPMPSSRCNPLVNESIQLPQKKFSERFDVDINIQTHENNGIEPINHSGSSSLNRSQSLSFSPKFPIEGNIRRVSFMRSPFKGSASKPNLVQSFINIESKGIPSVMINYLMIIFNLLSTRDCKLFRSFPKSYQYMLLYISVAYYIILDFYPDYILDSETFKSIDSLQYDDIRQSLLKCIQGLYVTHFIEFIHDYLPENVVTEILSKNKHCLESMGKFSELNSGNDQGNTANEPSSDISAKKFIDEQRTFQSSLQIINVYPKEYLIQSNLYSFLQNSLNSCNKFLSIGGNIIYDKSNLITQIQSNSFTSRFQNYSNFDIWLQGNGRFILNLLKYLSKVINPTIVEYNFFYLLIYLLSNNPIQAIRNDDITLSYKMQLIDTEIKKLRKIQETLMFLGSLQTILTILGRSYYEKSNAPYVYYFTPLALQFGNELLGMENHMIQNRFIESINYYYQLNKPPEMNCMIALQLLIRKCCNELLNNTDHDNHTLKDLTGRSRQRHQKSENSLANHINAHYAHHKTQPDSGQNSPSENENQIYAEDVEHTLRIIRIVIQIFNFIGSLCKGDNIQAQSFLSGNDPKSFQHIDITDDLALLLDTILVIFQSMIIYITYEPFYEKLAPLIYAPKDNQKRRYLSWCEYDSSKIITICQFMIVLQVMFDNSVSLCYEDSTVSILQAINNTSSLLEFLGLMQLTAETNTLSNLQNISLNTATVNPLGGKRIFFKGGDPFVFYNSYLKEMLALNLIEGDPSLPRIQEALLSWYDIATNRAKASKQRLGGQFSSSSKKKSHKLMTTKSLQRDSQNINEQDKLKFHRPKVIKRMFSKKNDLNSYKLLKKISKRVPNSESNKSRIQVNSEAKSTPKNRPRIRLQLRKHFQSIFGVSYRLFIGIVQKTEYSCLRLLLSFMEFGNEVQLKQLAATFSDSILIQNLNSLTLELRAGQITGGSKELLASTSVAYISLIESIGIFFKETDNLLSNWSRDCKLEGFNPQMLYGTVEIIGANSRLRRLYFPIPNFVTTFWYYPEVQRAKDKIVLEVNRDSPDEKITDFLFHINKISTVMKRQEWLRRILTMPIHALLGGKTMYISSLIPTQRMLALIISLFLNGYFVYKKTFDAHLAHNFIPTNYYSWNIEATVVFLTQWFHLLLCGTYTLRMIVNSDAINNPKLIHLKNRHLEKNKNNQGIVSQSSFKLIPKLKSAWHSISYNIKYSLTLNYYFLGDVLWPTFLTGLSFLGLWGLFWFYVLSLLDMMFLFNDMYFLVFAISKNASRIGFTLILAFLCLYFYSILAYLFFNNQYQFNNHIDCSTPAACFKVHLDYGLYNAPDWNGDTFIKPAIDYGFFFPYSQVISSFIGTFYNITFVILINLVLQAIISGLIIDTFSQMREDNERILIDITDKCFICSISRDELEQHGVDFRIHIFEEHNMWHYTWFKMYLDLKDPLSYTSTENYAFKCMKEKRLFLNMMPIKRSMTLDMKRELNDDDDDDEKDQTSIQLQSIMKSLKKLSDNDKSITNQINEIRAFLVETKKQSEKNNNLSNDRNSKPNQSFYDSDKDESASENPLESDESNKIIPSDNQVSEPLVEIRNTRSLSIDHLFDFKTDDSPVFP